MTEEYTGRVRVTSPLTTAPAHVRRSVRQEIDESTGIGEVYMRSLIRAQLRAALTVAATLVLSIGALPLLFLAFDSVTEMHVLGVPVPWWILGVLVYPGPVRAGLGLHPPGRARRARLHRARGTAPPGRGMNATYGVVAVALVAIATLGIGAFGLRMSRTTSDFYVASRSVSPVWNSSAIGGEYLSAASFLGVAGLVLTHGADMLWYPIGWTTGYLLLLVFVAAPLRRSGAYTIPDFAQVRLQSMGVRTVASALVVAVGWLYLMPQFQGAGLTLRTVTGAPNWVGTVVVAVIVVVNVVSGGMRSITFVQAFQYWLKLTALLIPVFFLLHAWSGDGRPSPVAPEEWFQPFSQADGPGLYLTYSVMIATFLGTMGLPHVVVRFYTNPDGHAARRTTLIVLALLGTFYLLPTIYGVLGRIYARDLLDSGRADTVVLELPSRVIGGSTGEVLAALLTAGAFAAFLSTSSGLTMSVAGVVGQGLARGRISTITALRIAAAACVVVPLVLALSAERIARRELRDVRVRAGRLDVLPAAGPRHLVARPDGPGRHRRPGRRWAERRRRGDPHDRSAARRLVRRRDEPARRVVGADRVRPHDRRLPRDPLRRTRQRLADHGPAAHPRAPRRRPPVLTLPFDVRDGPFVVRGRPQIAGPSASNAHVAK